jgi:RNA polymerase sigma factor (TIGR02999 family)
MAAGSNGPAQVVAEADAKREITALLLALRQGDPAAMERLVPLVYDDLRRRARQQLRRMPHATLSTTGLVHEAYLKLAGSAKSDWQDRNHFFAVASKAMRSVVVDYARKRFAKKRGGMARPVELEDGMLRVEENAAEILAVHQALGRLAKVDGRLSDLVELRFFGGLSIEEAAQVLNVSDRTVKRDWTKARTLLFQLLREAT